jgi:hypothetical protein
MFVFFIVGTYELCSSNGPRFPGIHTKFHNVGPAKWYKHRNGTAFLSLLLFFHHKKQVIKRFV